MSNPLALAAKVWGKKMCICGALMGAGSLATVVVTPMVQKPSMPASYIAPKPMHVGRIEPHRIKPKPLCAPQYILVSNGMDYGRETISAPEPATLALLGAGLIGLGIMRRKT